MKQKRPEVYVWVTWLTKFITGEQQCEFQSWFKAHFQYDKVPSNFNSRKWNIKHTQLMHKRRDELEEKGYTVKLEDQNSFKLVLPKGITVSGKADIVGLIVNSDNIVTAGIVEDCKTGRPKDSDQVQILLYMMFLPLAIEKYRNIAFNGRVIYKDSTIFINQSDIDDDLKEIVWELIKRIGGDKPCRKVPSYGECRWCDIPKEDCLQKMEN